jgi:predicted lipoprotein with Yx(FWY)xxD motif
VRKSISLLTALFGTSLLLSACGSSSYSAGSSSATGSSATSASAPAESGAAAGGSGGLVKSAANATLGGTVLVDSRGMTLYALSGEGAGKFICATSACTSVWHPLTTSSAGTPAGSVGSLGTVTRPDGTKQVTFQGRPLYSFAQDRKPGEASGQGFKDVGTWSAVKVGASSTSQTSTSPSTGGESGGAASGGGYRY